MEAVQEKIVELWGPWDKAVSKTTFAILEVGSGSFASNGAFFSTRYPFFSLPPREKSFRSP